MHTESTGTIELWLPVFSRDSAAHMLQSSPERTQESVEGLVECTAECSERVERGRTLVVPVSQPRQGCAAFIPSQPHRFELTLAAPHCFGQSGPRNPLLAFHAHSQFVGACVSLRHLRQSRCHIQGLIRYSTLLKSFPVHVVARRW